MLDLTLRSLVLALTVTAISLLVESVPPSLSCTTSGYRFAVVLRASFGDAFLCRCVCMISWIPSVGGLLGRGVGPYVDLISVCLPSGGGVASSHRCSSRRRCSIARAHFFPSHFFGLPPFAKSDPPQQLVRSWWGCMRFLISVLWQRCVSGELHVGDLGAYRRV